MSLGGDSEGKGDCTDRYLPWGVSSDSLRSDALVLGSYMGATRAEPYMPDLSTFIYLINLSTSHPTLLRMNKRVAEASLTNDGNIRAGKK